MDFIFQLDFDFYSTNICVQKLNYIFKFRLNMKKLHIIYY